VGILSFSFPGSANCSLANTQHTLEQLHDVNANVGLGPLPSVSPPWDNDGSNNGNEDDDSLAIRSLARTEQNNLEN
jgi:hypothetical protein